MKKSFVALSTAILLSGVAFAANTQTTAKKPQKQHSEAFHKAMDSCMSAAGIQKPEIPKDAKSGDHPQPPQGDQNGTPPEPPKDANGKPMPPKDNKGKGNKTHNQKDQRPHSKPTDSQRNQVESCMAKAGFEKPKDLPTPPTIQSK